MNWYQLLDFSAALLYFLGALFFLSSIPGTRHSLKLTSLLSTAGGFVIHSLNLGAKIAMDPLFTTSQAQFYVSLLAWMFIFLYLLLWWRLKLQFLGLTASSLAVILFCSSLTVSSASLQIPAKLSSLWFSLHIVTLFLSIGFLAMAFGAGLCYIYADKQIKKKARIGQFRKNIPALTSFDRVNHWAVSIGFPLFTIGVLSGFMWAGFTWGSIFSWDPKELFSVLVWILFAFLFHQRLALGWKGRKPALLAVWLFLFCLGSLLIINLFLPTHHSFRL